MSEVILQTIVEKLEHFELLVKKENTPKDDESQQALLHKIEGIEKEVKVCAFGVRMFNNNVHQLTLKLDTYYNKLHQPISNTTLHKHHLHKGVWTSVTLFVVCTLLIVMLTKSYDSNAKYQANDTKYRLLKVTAGKNSSKVLYHLDSLYNANPERVGEQVAKREDSLAKRGKASAFVREGIEKSRGRNESITYQETLHTNKKVE